VDLLLPHSALDTESAGSFETSLLPTKLHHATSKNTVTSFTIQRTHYLLSRYGLDSDIHVGLSTVQGADRSSEGEQPWHRVTAITGYNAIQTVTQRVGTASYFCVTNNTLYTAERFRGLLHIIYAVLLF